MPRTARCLTAALAALAVAVPSAPVSAVPEAVPDRIVVASEPVARGALVYTPAPDRAPSTKVVDGRIDDWIGEAPRIGGQSRYDAGEHVHSDYLFDAWGADDGTDAERLATIDPLREAEPRLDRVDALQQAGGDQFDAPPPVGADDHYGDTDLRDAADLTEVRWAVQGDRLHLLVRVANLTDPAQLAVLVVADHDPAARTPPEASVLLTAAGASAATPAAATRVPLDAAVAVSADGWVNALEAALPRALLAGDGSAPAVAVLAGTVGADGAFTPGNAAYRSEEPVTIYSDRLQALALHAGQLDAFTTTLDLAAMARGATETVALGPGYHERIVTSGANISREQGEHGLLQPYGLFIPSGYDPAAPTPVTFWLHYRGGKAHSGAAWTPRLFTQLGEETGNVVVSPRGRGTSTWYVSEAHQDFFEVFADVHETVDVDPQRRYVSGYSMGGYGTWLLTTLYPDLFAAGYTQSGAVTQGAWTGLGPDGEPCGRSSGGQGPCFIEANEGDAAAQLTFRALDNLRHVPIAIHHGTDDELVPITGIERMALRLQELGYRHDLTRFLGYEHFTQAIVDEWADGAAWLQRFTAPADPRRVTYRVVPALVNAVNTVTADGVAYDFDPDGAYWVDGIAVRDADVADVTQSGLVDVESFALPEPATLPVPIVGAYSPLQHTTPYTRTGLDAVTVPAAAGLDPEVANRATVTLTGVAEATLDGDRMRLDPSEGALLEITSDGPATLHLTFAGASVAIPVEEGTTTVVVSTFGGGLVAA